MDKTIQQHINDNINELDNVHLSGQRRRHLESELISLKKYQANHLNNDYDPNPLELYCDEHPDALECKIYEV
jgi:hypothetical protein